MFTRGRKEATRTRSGVAASLMLMTVAGSQAVAGVESPEWTKLGTTEGIIFGTIKDVVEWDDGTGPALYFAGDFAIVGSAITTGVVKFDGEKYSPLGCGIQLIDPSGQSDVQGAASNYGEVETLCTWDPDGAGPLGTVLVAGGRFGNAGGATANNIAVWNGTEWSTLGAGLGLDTGLASSFIYSRVYDLISFNGQLYACGVFDLPAGENIGRWNGTNWENVGLLPGAWPQAMGIHNDGSGDALYVCGRDMGNVYKLVGSSWVAVGSNTDSDLNAIASFDPDGAGGSPALLCVAGRSLTFKSWNGSAWTPHTLYNGVDPNTLCDYSAIGGMAVYNNALYMTVGSSGSGGRSFDRQYHFLHRWDGTTLSPAGAGMPVPAFSEPAVNLITRPVVSSVSGSSKLWYASTLGQTNTSFGFVSQSNGVTTSASIPTASFGGHDANILVGDAAMLDSDGAGPQKGKLYCVGNFGSGVNAAIFDGEQFTALPVLPAQADPLTHQGSNGPRCTVFNDGTGEAFYVSITAVGGTTVYKLVGNAWVSVGNVGAFYHFRNDIGQRADRINDLIGFNDGTGNKLYVTGRFATVDGVACNHIARWNGTVWEPVGPAGPNVGVNTSSFVYEESGNQLIVHNDGSGPALYVAGRHNGAGGVSAPNLVRWNGAAWQAVGNAFDSFFGSPRLVLHNAPGGEQLFAGTYDSIFGGSTNLVRWNGSDWVDATAGLSYGQDSLILMGSFDIGCGDTKLLGYGSYVEDLIAADPLYLQLYGFWFYEWNGAAWSRVPGTFAWYETAFGLPAFAFQTSKGSGLLVSGILTGVNGNQATCGSSSAEASIYTAIWGCPSPSCPADFNGDGTRDVADLFAYINAWLAKTGSADFNNDSTVDVADLFAYINAWLAGC